MAEGHVAVVRVVARPAGDVGAAPDALQVRRQFAGAGDDVVTRRIKLLFDQGAVRLFVSGFRHQLLRGPPVIGAAAEIEAHPVEQLAVEFGVALEQLAVVVRQLRERSLHVLHLRFVRVIDRAQVHEDQDAVGAFDRQRAVGPRFSCSARGDHPRKAFQRMDASRVGLEIAVRVGQRRTAGRALDVANVLLEHLVGALRDVTVVIELIARFPRLQREPAVEAAGFRTGDGQHRHAVRARNEHPALEGAPVVRPADGGLAGLEINRAAVVAHLALIGAADGEVKGRHEEVRIHEAALPGQVELKFRGLPIQPALDQPAESRTTSPTGRAASRARPSA